jgi:hypothetical protein
MSLQWPPTGKSIDVGTSYAAYKMVAFDGTDASVLLRLSSYRTRGFFVVADKPLFPDHGAIIIQPGVGFGVGELDTEDGNLFEQTGFLSSIGEKRQHEYIYNAGLLAHSPAWNNTDGITDTQIVNPAGLVVNYHGSSFIRNGVGNAQGIPPTESGNCLFYSTNVFGFSLFSEPTRNFYDRNGQLCPQFPASTTGLLFPTSTLSVPDVLTVPFSFGKIHGVNSQINLSGTDDVQGNDPDGSYREQLGSAWGLANGGPLIDPALAALYPGVSTPDPANDVPVLWGPSPNLSITSNELLMFFGRGFSLIYPGNAPFEYWNPDHSANKINGSGSTAGTTADCTPYMPTVLKFRCEQLHLHDKGTFHNGTSGDGFIGFTYLPFAVDVDYWTPTTVYYLYQEVTDPGGTHLPPPPPAGGTGSNGLDMLNTRTGLYLAIAGGGLTVHKFATAFQAYTGVFGVDGDATASYPTLCQQTDGEGVVCFYRVGADAPPPTTDDPNPDNTYQYLKRTSYDGGQTWVQQQDTDGNEITMLDGKKWARIAVLGDGRRVRGEAVIYNDGSGKDKTTGKPDGTGLLVCDLYDALGQKIGTFPADGKGIGKVSADDAGFGLEYVNDRNHDLRVIFMGAGALVYAVSVDEGRSWVDITSQMA